MVKPAETVGGKRQLTQHGLNTVLWKLIKDLGGKYVISEAELHQIPEKAVLAVEGDGNTFCIRIGRVNESPIIGGSEILVQN